MSATSATEVPGATATRDEERPESTFRSRVLPWALLAPALVAAVAFAVLWQRAEGAQRAEGQLRDRAREFVLALTDFSSESIESDVDDIRSFATGRFAEEVDQLFSDETIAAIEEAEATSRAEVQEVFVQSMGSESASVFVVVSEEVTNKTLDEPEPGLIRLEIEMVKSASAWKVEDVRLFQSPGESLLPD